MRISSSSIRNRLSWKRREGRGKRKRRKGWKMGRSPCEIHMEEISPVAGKMKIPPT